MGEAATTPCKEVSYAPKVLSFTALCVLCRLHLVMAPCSGQCDLPSFWCQLTLRTMGHSLQRLLGLSARFNLTKTIHGPARKLGSATRSRCRPRGMSHANGIVVGLVGLFLIVGCCVWRANRNGLKQVSKEQFYTHIANLDKMQADQRL